ncbi:MAG: hypothetical protein WKF42_06670 [Solirubrobacteraceae bacterium]
MAATGDETLADEQRRRIQAGVSAIAAGILTIGGGALVAIVYSDRPTVPVLDALRERLGSGGAEPRLKALQVQWYGDNAISLILSALVLALAAAAMGLTLSHLYRSTKARRPELPRSVLYAAIAGPVLIAVAGLAQAIGVVVEASSFVNSSARSAEAARDILKTPVVVGTLQLLGVFALGFAFVLLALNAMRVGLLTRFMGVLGMIVGVLFIIPLGSSLPIVQAFWLCALGALFLGRWHSGLPPAWVTGVAQPWPTQQQLREARVERQADGGDEKRPRRERPEPPETPAPQMPDSRPHSSSKKHKRKRR